MRDKMENMKKEMQSVRNMSSARQSSSSQASRSSVSSVTSAVEGGEKKKSTSTADMTIMESSVPRGTKRSSGKEVEGEKKRKVEEESACHTQ